MFANMQKHNIKINLVLKALMMLIILAWAGRSNTQAVSIITGLLIVLQMFKNISKQEVKSVFQVYI